MKKLFNRLVLPFMLLIMVAGLAYGQTDVSAEDGPGWITTASFIINGILGVIGYFLNGAKEKAKEGLAKAEQKAEDYGTIANTKIDQAIGLVNKVKEALDDDKVTPEEIKGIIKAGKEILNK